MKRLRIDRFPAVVLALLVCLQNTASFDQTAHVLGTPLTVRSGFNLPNGIAVDAA